MSERTKARLVDVARLAGVSPATVSRAMTQPELLAESTRSHVHAVARQLGYRPDGMARALASGRTMTVGAIVPTLDSTIFARFLQSMQSALAREGYQLLVASHELNPAAETEAVRTLLARGVDGLVLVGAERARETAALLAGAGVPSVLTWCGDTMLPAVTVDNERAGTLAAQHLLELGHRSFGMVTGPLAFNDRQTARLAGVRNTLRKAGLDLPESRISQQSLTVAGGRSGCATLLALADRPTAMIGGIDLIAVGCMLEAQSNGVTVPDALSIVGIDDIDLAAHIRPPLTTVHIPTARIGQSAAEMICRAIHAPNEARHIQLPIELIVRQSTAPPR